MRITSSCLLGMLRPWPEGPAAILRNPSLSLAGSFWQRFRVLQTLKVYLAIPGGTAAHMVMAVLTGGGE